MRLDKRWWFVVVLVGLMALLSALDLGRYLSLASIKNSQVDLEAWHAARPLPAGSLFFAGYVAVAALSRPDRYPVTRPAMCRI